MQLTTKKNDKDLRVSNLKSISSLLEFHIRHIGYVAILNFAVFAVKGSSI